MLEPATCSLEYSRHAPQTARGLAPEADTPGCGVVTGIALTVSG